MSPSPSFPKEDFQLFSSPSTDIDRFSPLFLDSPRISPPPPHLRSLVMDAPQFVLYAENAAAETTGAEVGYL